MEECELQIERLTADVLERELSALESMFGMSSDEFLIRYNSGVLGDDMELIRWSGILRTASQAGVVRRSRVPR